MAPIHHNFFSSIFFHSVIFREQAGDVLCSGQSRTRAPRGPFSFLATQTLKFSWR